MEMTLVSVASILFPFMIGWFFDKGHPDPDSLSGRIYYTKKAEGKE